MIMRDIALALLFLSAVVVSWPAHAKASNAKEDQERASQSAQSPTNTTIINQVNDRSANNSEPAKTEDSYIEQLKKKAKTDPLVWVTSLLAVIAFLQVGIYWAMHRTTKAIERAWVSLEELDIEYNEKHDRIIVIGLRNAGHTPAHIVAANVTIRGSTVIQEGNSTTMISMDSLPDKPEYDAGTFVPPAILVAGELSRWRYRAPVTNDSAWNLLTMHPGDKQPLWIYGFVTYRDTLSPRKLRTYRWAREYDAELSGRRERMQFAHMAKPKYNYAD